MPVIDADCHVIETEETWSFVDPGEEHFRPLGRSRAQSSEDDQLGRARGVLSGMAQTTRETRTMVDIQGRLRHMDQLGVDVQILYPSAYLSQLTADPAAEVALCRSYNRWLANIWEEGQGRLRWIAVPPLLNMDESIAQLREAKDHGACGVNLRGFEGDRILADPYFFPLYEEAQELDLPICVHAGNANPAFGKLVAKQPYSGPKIPVLSAFHAILFAGIPDQFPRLRFGFIEAAAQWLPYLIIDLRRRLEREGKRPLSADPLKDNRVYVACQTNDDIPYIMQYVGEDNLVIGSDYGHSDTSSELEALRNFQQGGELSATVVRKILEDNPRALYGL
jgi:uncharacterized protein